MKKITLLLILLTFSCIKPEEEIPDLPSSITFIYSVVEITSTKGLSMPECTNGIPFQFRAELTNRTYKSNRTVYHPIGESLEFSPAEYSLDDFTVLDQDRNELFRMPRAVLGRIFIIDVAIGQSIIVDVPVACLN